MATRDLPQTQHERPQTAGDEALIAFLRGIIVSVMRDHHTPGLNLALARHGNIIWEAGFGLADVATDTRMTPQSVFRSGSTGKPYTGIAAMQLVERGRLELDADVEQYLPFAVRNPLGDGPVTLRHLMSHQSGLAAWDSAGASYTRPPPLEEQLRRDFALDRLPQVAGDYAPLWTSPVGKAVQYSAIGVATVGLIVERVNPHGLSFSDYVQQQIMDPLGMTSSQYPPVHDPEHMRPELWERLTTGYMTMGSVWLPSPMVYYGRYPAGSSVGTPGDHIRLLLMMMAGGSWGGQRILQQDSVEAMLTPQSSQCLPPTSFRPGLLWMLNDWTGPRASFSHNGTQGFGWRNMAGAWPQHETAIVIAVNQMSCPRPPGDLNVINAALEEWLATAPPEVERNDPTDAWSWKLSYCRGLIAVEAINGFMGVETPLASETARQLATDARLIPGQPADWDADGFLAGVADMQQEQLSIEGIRAFARSDRIKLAQAELEQAFYELGVEPGKENYLSYLNLRQPIRRAYA